MSRTAAHPIDPKFLDRWSPRAYDAQPITHEELFTVLEAGRWAPSSFNLQPWRFLYAQRDTPAWKTFLGLLIEYNQSDRFAWILSRNEDETYAIDVRVRHAF